MKKNDLLNKVIDFRCKGKCRFGLSKCSSSCFIYLECVNFTKDLCKELGILVEKGYKKGIVDGYERSGTYFVNKINNKDG